MIEIIKRIEPSPSSSLLGLKVELYSATTPANVISRSHCSNPFLQEVTNYILARPHHQHVVVVQSLRDAYAACQYLKRMLPLEPVVIGVLVNGPTQKIPEHDFRDLSAAIAEFEDKKIACLIVVHAHIIAGQSLRGDEHTALSMTFALRNERELTQLAHRVRYTQADRLLFKHAPRKQPRSLRQRIVEKFQSINR